MDATSPPRAFALVGPGRAGSAVACALAARGWRPAAVAGRTPDAPSTRAVAARLAAPAVEVADAGREADVVIVATPDAAIAGAAAALAPALCTGALVVHLSGASTLHELDGVLLARPDVEVGSLHPLQSLPSADVGQRRLAGAWCAIDGSPRVEKIALTLGMRPFRVDAADRVQVPRGRVRRLEPRRGAARPGRATGRARRRAVRGVPPAGPRDGRERGRARSRRLRSPAPSRAATTRRLPGTSTLCRTTSVTRTRRWCAKHGGSPRPRDADVREETLA